MNLLKLFGKRAEEPAKEEEPEEALDVYSGMRVEVTDADGRMLFVAKLLGLRGSQAELHQYSESDLPQEEEPLPVKIRGYSDRKRKAVYMEGAITPMPQHKWSVTELRVCKVENDRAFFRLETNLDATATMFSGLAMGEKPCKLLNISVGGARVSSEQQYWEGDKLLLTVKLLEDRDPSIMYCQVLRVIEKEDGPREYGCQFLEMNEADQDKITENIFAAQRKSRKGS